MIAHLKPTNFRVRLFSLQPILGQLTWLYMKRGNDENQHLSQKHLLILAFLNEQSSYYQLTI